VYKFLLCWRYLRTRYLAFACIISVMLGVATLIVVNSVMSGFSMKLRDRLHGLLSDVVVEANGVEGFPAPEEKLARIRAHKFLSKHVDVMTPTLEAFAMLQFPLSNGEMMTRQVHLVGVDVKTRTQLGGFKEHLAFQRKNAMASFEVSEEVRRRYEARHEFLQLQQGRPQMPLDPDEPPPPEPPKTKAKIPQGVFIGNLIASFKNKDSKTGEIKDYYLLNPGDQVIITTVGGQRLNPVFDQFVVVDYFKSEMSEYDMNYVFVPLDYLQHLRTMQDRVTSIQIKLKDYAYAKQVVEELKMLFPPQFYRVSTWEDKQGPLLAAISVEKGILNVLLFMIIGVAGFGILAIFSMIVTEKTRDIGIMKALGASSGGIMQIFLGYGLLLGIVGSTCGTSMGLMLTTYINEVEKFLTYITGSDVFPRDVYYFNEIPTYIDGFGIVLINLGAIAIAVGFSILPALRAALLHPVRALRYE